LINRLESFRSGGITIHFHGYLKVRGHSSESHKISVGENRYHGHDQLKRAVQEYTIQVNRIGNKPGSSFGHIPLRIRSNTYKKLWKNIEKTKSVLKKKPPLEEAVDSSRYFCLD